MNELYVNKQLRLATLYYKLKFKYNSDCELWQTLINNAIIRAYDYGLSHEELIEFKQSLECISNCKEIKTLDDDAMAYFLKMIEEDGDDWYEF